MNRCAKKNSQIKKDCGKPRVCKLCPRKARFAVEGRGNKIDSKDHLKVSVGPDPETIEKEVRLCCCNDRIHFSGDGVDVELREGSALVEVITNNILCAATCTNLPDASETVGQLVVCADTKQLFFSAECTNGKYIEVGIPMGLTCGGLLRGDDNNNIEQLLVGTEGQFLTVQGGKPNWIDLNQPVINSGIFTPLVIANGNKVQLILANRQIYQRINNIVHLTGLLFLDVNGINTDDLDLDITLPITPAVWPNPSFDAIVIDVISDAETTAGADAPAIGGAGAGRTDFKISQSIASADAGAVRITYTVAYRVNA